MTERAPVPCPEMHEICAQIDTLDKRLVALLAERQKLIAAAGEVKPSRDTVRDEARIEEVVQLVLAEAENRDWRARLQSRSGGSLLKVQLPMNMAFLISVRKT